MCFAVPSLRSSTNELAVLISRMQTNADQVEKDILETQSRLRQVSCASGWWEVKGFAEKCSVWDNRSGVCSVHAAAGLGADSRLGRNRHPTVSLPLGLHPRPPRSFLLSASGFSQPRLSHLWQHSPVPPSNPRGCQPDPHSPWEQQCGGSRASVLAKESVVKSVWSNQAFPSSAPSPGFQQSAEEQGF